MPYIIMVDDLETGFVEAYREQGKVVHFATEWEATAQRYLLLDTKDGRTRRYDVQYVKKEKK